MSKTTTSITLDDENYEFTAQEHINRSALVNKLLTQYRKSGGSEDALKQMRMQRLKDEWEEAAQKAGHKRQQYVSMMEADTEPDISESEREDVLAKFDMIPVEEDGVNHPYVQQAAEELEVTPEKAIEMWEEME